MDLTRPDGLGACLADDMGLGKTAGPGASTSRKGEVRDAEPGAAGARRSLVVCPTSVVGNWEREAKKFVPELKWRCTTEWAAPGRVKIFRKMAGADLVITSYSACSDRDADAVLESVHWSVEWRSTKRRTSRTPGAKQTRARAFAARRATAFALTGTPVENHVGDLWSIMEFLNPGSSARPTRSGDHFSLPHPGYEQTTMPPSACKRLTGPFILRRLKTDQTIIADLPDKLEMKVFCTLTREQASLYAAVVDEMLRGIDEAEGIERQGLVLATLTKLKQMCNHPAQFLGDGSACPAARASSRASTEMLEEVLAAGDKALVFTQFAEMGDHARAHLQERFGLRGAVPARRHAQEQRDAHGRALPGRADGPRVLRAVAEGGRHGPQPDGREPRLPLRPLVEPGRGEPGHRPRLSHRPAPAMCRSTS